MCLLLSVCPVHAQRAHRAAPVGIDVGDFFNPLRSCASLGDTRARRMQHG
jgi:hypothetical protein